MLWSVSLTTGSLYDKHKDPSRHVSDACMYACIHVLCKSHLKVTAACSSGCVSQAYLRISIPAGVSIANGCGIFSVWEWLMPMALGRA